MIRRIPDTTWTDEDLVRACRAGDQTAWGALVDKYKKLVYSVPARYQLPPEEAADVFQGVWIDLYRDLDRLERVAGLRAWLVTAAARRSMLHKKRRQRLLKSGDLDPQFPDGAPFVDRLFENAQREQKLRDSIGRLPERCQRLVRMLFFEHPPRPYSEVARELGLAEGSIGFIRGRCLEKLRKQFEQQEE
ncbi:MAG: sigma-70 family RNA polymerase sigma factor [Acidobacteriia bacterium]|nr:sigma-70 family RNA polymerase sigma factor [Terriglobia bacterium]